MSYFGKFWHITNKEKGGQNAPPFFCITCREPNKILTRDPGETRTHGQWLKRPLLYQLSYRIKKY